MVLYKPYSVLTCTSPWQSTVLHVAQFSSFLEYVYLLTTEHRSFVDGSRAKDTFVGKDCKSLSAKRSCRSASCR